MEHIFEPFYQAERTIDRSRGGLGIGLTLVRRLTELHGGRVSVSSDGAGKGCEFVVTLPAAAEPEPETVRRPALRSKAFRILIADDNQDGADGLKMMLELLGHDVEVAHDGQSAIEAASKTQPDLMVLDIGLPVMSGYEVARRLRNNPKLKSMVLVALTGYGADSDKARSEAAGFDYHLVKPVEFETLKEVISELVAAVTIKTA
jgi:CheY-like chemotaxis protein